MRIIRRKRGTVQISQGNWADIKRTMTVRKIVRPDGTVRHCRVRLRRGLYKIDSFAAHNRDLFRRIA